MEVDPTDFIEDGKTYKMELHFPDANWLTLVGVKLKVLLNCDGLDIGAKWIASTGDTLFLEYHLKATGREITHGELFQGAIKAADDGAMWIDCIELGVREPVLEPDVPLPDWLEWLKKIIEDMGINWKLAGGIILAIIASLVVLKVAPYGGKRKVIKR